MKEFVVYILFSKKYNKTYVGYTSNLIERFKSHNLLSIKGYTIKFRPWEVNHVEFYYSKSEALKREKYFKSRTGRDHIKILIQNDFWQAHIRRGGHRFESCSRY